MMSWGPNLIKSYADGMLSQKSALESAAKQLADAVSTEFAATSQMRISAAQTTGSTMAYGAIAVSPAPSYVNNSRQITNHFDFSNLTIRDERDINLLADQIGTVLNRKWAVMR
jgi:hypothetical protein